MSRERRKAKEHEKDYEKEGEKRDEMVGWDDVMMM